MAEQKFLKFYHPGLCECLNISSELTVCPYDVTSELRGV